ncbi:hypothetical protein HYT02_02110 [Candidatus Gottesmanbacteria bacterium]|nr:hypothetical protein [Candidatus Gottesmanbacteria bacterium]
MISKCQDSKEVGNLLTELLTKTERTIIAKRLFIGILLTKGYSYRQIRTLLKVSFPTITMVKFWLEHGGGGYKIAIERILGKDEFNNVLQLIDKIIDRNSPDVSVGIPTASAGNNL